MKEMANITKILSIEDCLELMDKYGMPEHIKSHSFKVRDIGVYLSKELNKKNENLNVELVESSALVHDIAKIHCINSKKKHDKVGADILRNLGYDRIAEIVEQHITLWQTYNTIKEEEIVHYSDRRVLHDKLVPLSERFEYIEKRYGSINEVVLKRIKLNEQNTCTLEKKIFKNLDFSPDDLNDLI